MYKSVSRSKPRCGAAQKKAQDGSINSGAESLERHQNSLSYFSPRDTPHASEVIQRTGDIARLCSAPFDLGERTIGFRQHTVCGHSAYQRFPSSSTAHLRSNRKPAAEVDRTFELTRISCEPMQHRYSSLRVRFKIIQYLIHSATTMDGEDATRYFAAGTENVPKDSQLCALMGGVLGTSI